MQHRNETIPIVAELSKSTQEFTAALCALAPAIQDGNTAQFTEHPDILRGAYETRTSCSVTPSPDLAHPPKVSVFRGVSAIWNKVDTFSFSPEQNMYLKTVVITEPLGETELPNEYYHPPVPATDLELGKVLGIVECLVLTKNDQTEVAERQTKKWSLSSFIVRHTAVTKS